MEQQIHIKASSKEDFEKQKLELEQVANKTIFREVPPKGKLWKAQYWVFNKIFNWMHRWLNYTSPEVRRFNRHHFFAKNFIVHRGLRFIRWSIKKKNTVKKFEDIKPEWYNNHLRMFYYSWEQAMENTWEHHIYAMSKINDPNHIHNKLPFDEWLRLLRKGDNRSYEMRILLMQLWVTECLEDTVDREHMNMLMMNITHQMMKYYGVSEQEQVKVPKPGQFPVYLSGGPVNPEYFFYGRNIPVWKPNMTPVTALNCNPCQEPKVEVEVNNIKPEVVIDGKKSKKIKTH